MAGYEEWVGTITTLARSRTGDGESGSSRLRNALAAKHSPLLASGGVTGGSDCEDQAVCPERLRAVDDLLEPRECRS
jgi:hypothetical protein